MTLEHLKGKSSTELKKTERELREKIFRLKFSHRLGQLKQTSEMKKTKQALARVLTVMNTEKRS
ncbi:MAG: 50S ribosomal protein L29 [Deltaproteobacteria bacterium]|nr:50S ribosomal protein L29 [Deltaproteobacteria bacterium]